MQETQGKNNAQTLFGVFQIPTDNHIRSLLDGVEPTAVYPMFDFIVDGFQRSGVIDAFLGRTADCCRPWTAPSTIRHKSGMARAFHARHTATAKPAIRIRW